MQTWAATAAGCCLSWGGRLCKRRGSERLRHFSAHFVATQVAFSLTLFKCQVQMCTRGNCFCLLSACACQVVLVKAGLRLKHDSSCFMSCSWLSSHIPERVPQLLITLICTVGHKVGIVLCTNLCLFLIKLTSFVWPDSRIALSPNYQAEMKKHLVDAL